MKNFLTQTRLLMMIMFAAGAVFSAKAQTYPELTVTTNVGATGIAKDAAGNVYVIQATADPRNGGAKQANIVKYAAGGTTGATLKNSSGAAISFGYNDGESDNNYPMGIAVDGSGNIFVSTYTDYLPNNGGDLTAYGGIIEFTNNGSSYSGPAAFATGSYNFGTGTSGYGPMVIDGNNNIFRNRL